MLSLAVSSTLENNQTPIFGSREVANPENESSLVRSTALTAQYGLTSRLGLILSAPYRDIRSPKDPGGSRAKQIDRHFSGLGDAIFLSRYRLNPGARQQDAAFNALLGARLPTGSANPNHTWTARDGSRILSRDAVLQPGFGTLDPILGAQWSKSLSHDRSAYLSALYRHSGGTNRFGYRYGSELQMTLGASLPLGRKVTFLPQFLGQVSGHDYDFNPLPGKTRGQVFNTGGAWLYFMPTLQVGAFEFNIQLPIYRNTNGPLLSPSAVFTVRRRMNLTLTAAARRKRRTPPSDELDLAAPDYQRINPTGPEELPRFAVPGKTTLFQFVSRSSAESRKLVAPLNSLLAQRPDVAVRQIDISDLKSPTHAGWKVEQSPAFLVFGPDAKAAGDQLLDFPAVEQLLDAQLEAEAEKLAREVPIISSGAAVDLKEHLAEGKITMFQFFTPYCDASRSVSSAVRHLLDATPGLELRRIDVTDGESEVVRQHQVEVTPTFYVYDRKGRLTGRLAAADHLRLAKLVRQAQRVQRKGAPTSRIATPPEMFGEELDGPLAPGAVRPSFAPIPGSPAVTKDR